MWKWLARFIEYRHLRRELLRMVRAFFVARYSDSTITSTEIIAWGKPFVIVAVSYFDTFPSRPSLYRLFKVSRSSMEINELSGEEFERYRKRPYK